MTLSFGVQARTDGVPDAPVSSTAPAAAETATRATMTRATTHLTGLRPFFGAEAAATTGAVATASPAAWGGRNVGTAPGAGGAGGTGAGGAYGAVASVAGAAAGAGGGLAGTAAAAATGSGAGCAGVG